MTYKRILTIQDISCLGQCSMTVALPVLSACGHEVCILPSAMLSTHTGGFQRPVVQNLTVQMGQIREHWIREGITFDVIFTGYLGSIEAVQEVRIIIDTMLAPGGTVIVDPAMADHGKLYRGFDDAYAQVMMTLCTRADIILPNVTEAAMMTGEPFREELDETYVRKILEKLPGKGVLLTGVGFSPDQTGFALRESDEIIFHHHPRVGGNYHGTGDLFAAAFTGAIASQKTAADAGRIASAFTLRAIENTVVNPAHWYGVKFETALPYLMEILNSN